MSATQDLWQFANRLYSLPGISEACLRLQDAYGVDVCVLMLLLWLAQDGRAVRVSQVQMILRTSAEWREEVIVPLRQIRRRLKQPPAMVEVVEAESLRSAVKAAELRAERLEIDSLTAMFGDSRICEEAPCGAPAARRSLRSYEEALAAAFPEDTIEILIRGLQELP